MNKITINESELPTPDKFIRGTGSDGKGNHCAEGWFRELVYNHNHNDIFNIFNEKFMENATAMNLKTTFPLGTTLIPMYNFNDHRYNSFEDISECFNKTMRDLEYVKEV